MHKSSRPSRVTNIAQSKPFIIEGLLNETKRKEFPSSINYQLHKKNPIGVIVEKENQKSSTTAKLNPQPKKKSSRQVERTKLLNLADWWVVDCKDFSIDLGEKNWYDELSDLLPAAVEKHEQKEIASVKVLEGIIYSL
jgi:hypothetical protein